MMGVSSIRPWWVCPQSDCGGCGMILTDAPKLHQLTYLHTQSQHHHHTPHSHMCICTVYYNIVHLFHTFSGQLWHSQTSLNSTLYKDGLFTSCLVGTGVYTRVHSNCIGYNSELVITAGKVRNQGWWYEVVLTNTLAAVASYLLHTVHQLWVIQQMLNHRC